MCRVTMGHLRVTIGHPRVTIGHPRVTIGQLRVTTGHPRVTSISKHKANTTELHPKVRQTCLNKIMSLISNQMKLVNQQENSRPTV